MDEKTEQLRDIFLDVADEGTVTEHQEDARGSLAPDGDVEERLASVVETMRGRYDLRTDLSTDDLVAVVEAFYAGESDAEIARRLDDADAEAVARARLGLHLVAERDLDAPFDLEDLRALLDADAATEEIAAELDADAATVRRYRRVVEVQDERRLVGDRFREEFERILEDRDLADRLTADVHQDGLEDATEGMETNVSF